jgi:type IV pilus assembly protein PilW
VTIFLASKESYRMQEGLARLQENARFALGRLSQELQQAGFAGCPTRVVQAPTLVPPVLDQAGNALPESSKFLDYGQPVDGLGGGDAAIPTQFAGLAAGLRPTGASDVLFIRAAAGREDRVQGQANACSPLAVSGQNAYSARAVVVVSDCEGAYVAQLQSPSTPTSLAVGCLGRGFPEGQRRAEVQPVRNDAYFIAGATPQSRALWRWDGIDAAEETVGDLSQMWTQFGVDADNDGAVEAYLDADGVSALDANRQLAWRRVRTVRVVLMLESPDVVIDGAEQRQSAAATTLAALDRIDPALRSRVDVSLDDGRLRQIATTTVALRNRSL